MMSQNVSEERLSFDDRNFDIDWYLSRYPDVALSGLDPIEHYHWLGRRLGRQAIRPTATEPPQPVLSNSRASASSPYDNVVIAAALKNLCAWLFPVGPQRGLTAAQFADSVANHFWNDESGGKVVINPNGKLLVDFMQNYRPSRVNGNSARQRRPRRPKSILLASFYAPTQAHAGGLRILDLYREIRARHPKIRLTLFCARNPDVDGDISALGSFFDDVFFCEPHEFEPETLSKTANRAGQHDLIDLQFHQAGLRADGFRRFGKFVIYTPMEVLSRVDFDIVRKRTAEGELPLDKLFSLIHRGGEEHRIMQSVDTTVCVSDADAEFLQTFCGKAQVSYFPTGLSPSEFGAHLVPRYRPVPTAKRKNRLVFAAYFGSETNSAGLQWYLREIHPKVLAACPTYNLAVVGRGDTRKLEALGSPSVSFIGEVPRLSPVLEQCKAGLVLALHGSGFRGKINQYALCGLPSISTSLGSTGLSYVDDEDILIADEPIAFADKCISVLTKERETQRLAKAARKRALDCYSWSSIWPKIAPIYGLA